MEIKLEKLSSTRVKLIVSVSSAELEGYSNQAIENLSPSVNVAGFRPGKAPKQLVIEAVGQGRYEQELLNVTLGATYPQAVEKNNIIPIEPPNIQIKESPHKQKIIVPGAPQTNRGLVYEAEVDILPEMKLGDYSKIKVTLPTKKVEANTDEINNVLGQVQRQHAKIIPVGRPAKQGDRIEIDFEGKVDQVIRDDLTSKNFPLILGSKVLIPGFEDHLIGMTKGEEKEFSLDVPKLKNKVNFKVKIIDIAELKLPALDNDLAKKLGLKDFQELQEKIKATILQEKEHEHQHQVTGKVLDEVLKLFEVEVPQSLVERELSRMIQNLQDQVIANGLTWEKYLEQIKKSVEELRSDLKPQAEKSVKIGLMLGEVIKREGIDSKDQQAPQKAIEHLIGLAVKEK